MSEPIGIYVRTSGASPDLVEFCPPELFATLSHQRGYRAAGNCPEGAAPLLKIVIAHAGDIVDVTERGLAVNGVLLANTAPRAIDSAGRPLAHYPYGRYVVGPGMVWLASSYHPRSFDSRYFGPVPVDQIRSHLRALVVVE